MKRCQCIIESERGEPSAPEKQHGLWAIEMQDSGFKIKAMTLFLEKGKREIERGFNGGGEEGRMDVVAVRAIEENCTN